MADATLLTLYRNRDEQAIQKTMELYGVPVTEENIKAYVKKAFVTLKGYLKTRKVSS